MRKIVFAACIITTCGLSIQAADVPLAKLTWLAGDWQVTNGPRVVEEHWTLPSANSLLGLSRTVRDGRTIAFEFVRIEQRDQDIFYVAQPNGRPPTDFRLSSSADGELVFEGDGRDRVKRITYRREGQAGLYALVEGEENGRAFKQEFRYKRPAPVMRPVTQ